MQEKGRKGAIGRRSDFDEAFKIAVAREYLTGHLSFSQLARKHGLPGRETPRYFVNWYKAWLAKNESLPQEDPPENLSHTLELERRLKEANLRITALEMMIKNAEKELGVDIVKKSGTKQQGK